MNLTPNSKSSISLVKFLTPNSKTYKIKNPMFKHIDIVGEVHGGKKDEPTGLSEYIEKNGYEIIILEVPKSYMTKTMNELKKGYNQQIIKNATAKPRDDSYIDNVMNYFINTHYSFKIKYKKLINVKNIKLQCLDDRPLKDYPDKSISVMYKTKQEQLIIELLKKITEIKKKVIKMDASKINNNLLTIINFNFKNLLNKKSKEDFRKSMSAIILDYNIIEFILLKKNKNKKIIIVCGNNHLHNLSFILDSKYHSKYSKDL